ncbi:hypothetical protein [Acanthopleuribacter pedis]|uniref:Uncharacterized protein n=1 Tax=Acanthopleuribacter pedis TaxID=442870 RepID=A0A8J7QF89_9BACT|nr:hypothetical protein [Acanthopleuribacter pedis]MBO1318740.1 hypothetical protein [Acanthopleuribacter pedis]
MSVFCKSLRTLFPICIFIFPAYLAAAPVEDVFEVSEITTSIHLYPDFLEKSGLAIIAQEPSANPRRFYPGFTGYRGTAAQPFQFVAQGGDFEHFDGIGPAFTHEGGFVLSFQNETIDLTGFRLVPEPGTVVFSLRDAQDEIWFTMQFPHAELMLGRAKLEMRHMDLGLGPALAKRIGHPTLAGYHVGIAEVELAVRVPDSLYKHLKMCTPDYEGAIDIELTNINFVGQLVANTERVALAPSAELRNVGEADVPWFRAIEPDGTVGEHPYLVMNMYRMHEGRIEQIGSSDVKHAFFAINSGCDCPGDQILFAGCTDLYAASTNGDFFHLAPRDEVHAFTGDWDSLGSHFDGEPVDNRRDHFAGDHDAFDHRLVVDVAELSTENARYFVDAWYVVGEDINLFNNMGYREVRPNLNGAIWSFTLISSQMTGSVLDMWVDPLEPSADETHQVIDTGEGRYSIASRTESLDTATRYHYSLFNHDFDRQLNTLHIPIPPGFEMSNLLFLDGDTEAANDWQVSQNEMGITWTAPTETGLDWGRLISFSFDIALAPELGNGQVTYLETGETSWNTIPVLLPSCKPQNQWSALLPQWPSVKVTTLVAERAGLCATP